VPRSGPSGGLAGRRASCGSGSSRRGCSGGALASWTPCSRWCRRKWKQRYSTWRRRAHGAARISLLEWAPHLKRGKSTDGEAAPRGRGGRPGRVALFRGCARLDARHPRLPGRIGPRESAPAVGAVVDLLRAFPYDFLYGTSPPTHRWPRVRARGRHSTPGTWPGNLRPGHTDPLRAFGLGYLSHLAADAWPTTLRAAPARAHFQHAALGHATGRAGSRPTRPATQAPRRSSSSRITRERHPPRHDHLTHAVQRGTSRRLFRGMVHLTESESWRWRSR